jgi:hypothetical protein
MSSELVSLREFARRKNWNPGYAHRLKTQGRLVVVDGKVDVEASERALAESADPARAHLTRGRSGGAERDDDEPVPQAVAPGGAPLSQNATFNRARTATQVFDAKLKELEFKKRTGQLIDVGEARRLAFTAFRTLRDAILNVPARVQAEFAVETDPLVIATRLQEELQVALSAFSVEQAVADAGDDDDAG